MEPQSPAYAGAASAPAGVAQASDAAPPMAPPAARASDSIAPRSYHDSEASEEGFDEEAAADHGAGAAARSEPRARPGLGTVWGEDRTSHIRHTAFHRAEPTTPFAVATLFYNDRNGVRAMARESAAANHGDGGFGIENGAVTVRLLDAHGRSLPAFEVASRDYVIGEHGQQYTIELSNHTGERIEAVVSVDGLDVVDGETGSFSKRGYVIGPFDTLEIDGFRRSMDTVAAFRFGAVGDSYAAKKGKARNVGVIGVALFHERGSDLPWTRREVNRRHTADPFPGRFAVPPPR